MHPPDLIAEFTIPASHPSLPGHFPGNPIVPGVVILDQVTRLWQARTAQFVNRIDNTKFTRTLLADTPCQTHYQQGKPGQISFTVFTGTDTIIAKGSFCYESNV
jgi:3-hydroxyacyl-[acyl-carrier-protein] dehydratase